jgi:uncharacterized membrane protein
VPHYIADLYAKWKSEPLPHRYALVALMIIAVVLRVANLDYPIRIDEKATFALYVTKPWAIALSDYSLPNNHLFHTALAKLSTGLFGGSLVALRLPALVAGVLVVPATYVATRLLYGARAAMFATAIAATSWELVINSANARGYSLITLAFLLLVIIAVRLQEKTTPGRWIAFAVIGAIGLWTIPVMLFPLGAIAAWLTLSSIRRRAYAELGQLALALGGAALLTALCYAPAVAHSGLAAITKNEYVTPSSWSFFLSDLAFNLRLTLFYWGLTTPTIIVWMLAICALIAIACHGQISRERVGVPHAALLWCTVFLLLNHRAPPERVWQWLIPVAAGLAGAGLLHAVRYVYRRGTLSPRHLASLVVALALINGTSVLLWAP